MRLAIAFLFVTSWIGCIVSYDYASTCSRAHRSSRLHPPPGVPCDLSKQIYCTSPGDNYPWQAIRSFIRENQGLMKRMYGDERHISVLKAELDNFIEEDKVEKVKKPSEFNDDAVRTKMFTMKNQGRAMRVKPHFRPIQDKTRRPDNDTLSVKPLEMSNVNTKLNETKSGNKTEMSNETFNDDQNVSYKTRLESIANIEINDLEPSVITLETVVKQSVETNQINPYSISNLKKDQLKSDVKTSTSGKNATTATENIEVETTTNTRYEEITTVSGKEGLKPVNSDASTLPPTLLFSVHEKIDRVDTNVNEKKEEVNQKPQYLERPAFIKLGGENACESRTTLEAPFWANNTKNELLALVNMYPFEQYIHMETCVHEKKQMYCREGCRCEQQYRFHRLLAYDPRNECRGIFADWFKFPVCCVCKCYDVPVEFRARSPRARILPPQYDDTLKRIIYDDVARDWYSSSFGDDPEDLF